MYIMLSRFARKNGAGNWYQSLFERRIKKLKMRLFQNFSFWNKLRCEEYFTTKAHKGARRAEFPHLFPFSRLRAPFRQVKAGR
jgi:hypothetical protein